MTNTRSKKHVRRTEAENEMKSKVQDICAITALLKKVMSMPKGMPRKMKQKQAAAKSFSRAVPNECTRPVLSRFPIDLSLHF